MSYKGKYKVINKDKYQGDYTKVVYRSSWELAFMKYCDHNSSILKWNSEDVVIPYFDPSRNKNRRYFMDFWIMKKSKDGIVRELLIEVKPDAETRMPKVPKRKTQSYKRSIATYITNRAKWDAAEIWAHKRQMGFVVLTEKTMPILTGYRK